MTNNNLYHSIQHVISRDYVENKRGILLGCGSYLGFLILIAIWASGLIGSVPEPDDFPLYLFMAWFMTMATISRTFSDLKTKEGRISTLMTPASNSVKFWTRTLAVIIGTSILAVAGWYVYEYTKILTIAVVKGTWYACPGAMEFGDQEDIYVRLGIFVNALFNMAIFLFGAIAWPKKSFIKTLGLFALLGILLSTIIGFTVSGDISIVVIDGKLLFWWYFVFMSAIDVLILYAAFWKFKHTNVA